MTTKKVSSKESEKLLDKSLEDLISSFYSCNDNKIKERFLEELLVDFVDILERNPDFRLKIKAYIGKINEFFDYIEESKLINTDDLNKYKRVYNQLIEQYLPGYRRLQRYLEKIKKECK